MLGCVKEVADFEVTVSLPCGLQGFLSIRNICDSYAKLLSEQLDSADTEVGLHCDDLNRLGRMCHSGPSPYWYTAALSLVQKIVFALVLNQIVAYIGQRVTHSWFYIKIRRHFVISKKNHYRRYVRCRTFSTPAWCSGVWLPSWTHPKEAVLASSYQSIQSWSTRLSLQHLWKLAWWVNSEHIRWYILCIIF